MKIGGSENHVDNLWIGCGLAVDNRSNFVDNFSTLWKCGQIVENFPHVIHIARTRQRIRLSELSTFPHRLLLLLLYFKLI